jgi:HEAT repeat protein
MNELVMKLMFTCSPKIVPSLLDSMCDYGSGGGFWENEALTYYVPRSDETKRAILAAATARGLGQNWTLGSLLREYDFTKEELKPLIQRALAPDNEPGWGIGAELAQKFGDDAFTERLAAIATVPRSNARITAITALAAHRTDEGVQALKSLLNDPHENIWVPLAQALENGERQGTLRPEDFSAEDVKPLIRRMLAAGRNSQSLVAGVGLLEQFGSDEFTPQLVALVNDPGNWAWYQAVYALALNRTDEGVQTLKSLLNSSNQAAAEAIRYAYTNQLHFRGRPLKPEDFDKKLQQPEP